MVLRTQDGQFFFQACKLFAEFEHSLVLLRQVPLQMGVAFFEPGQSVGVGHGTIASGPPVEGEDIFPRLAFFPSLRYSGSSMKRFVLLLFLFAAACGLSFADASASDSRSALLILISIDGFRWDYLQKYPAPVLRRLAAEGVHARRLIPSFPSKTFPNHYTLVTGLYPEHHGIVGNTFFDPESRETFAVNKPETTRAAHWWSGGEPVWITAEKQGLRTACYFWPGSDAEIQGRRPSFFLPYDIERSSAARVDGLLAWLDLPPGQRPRFCTLYLDEVDRAGHAHGPEAPETAGAVRQVDDAMARLVAGLEARGLRDKTDLVIVSDHGMAAAGPDRVVFIEDLMDASAVEVEATGPVGGVRPKSGEAAALVASIRAKHPAHVQVYLREEVPEQLHYRASNRIPAVVLIADEHWNIESKAGLPWPMRTLTYNRGTHGWDPAVADMGALFIAHGPSFKEAHEFAEVENIQVYNLLCAALGLRPAPNDGDDRLVREALRR